MRHPRIGRSNLGRRHVPLLRCRRDQHLANRRGHLPQRIPVGRRRRASACVLPAVLRLIEVGLLDADARPRHAELVGEDHRQRRLDALTDLGILRDDRDDVVGRDLDEGVRNKRLPGSLRDDSRNRIEVRGDEHAATGQRRHAQERPSIELECRILCHRDLRGLRATG